MEFENNNNTTNNTTTNNNNISENIDIIENNEKITLYIEDLKHRKMLLNYYAQNATIRNLSDNCKYVLDSTNIITKVSKDCFKCLKIPKEGHFEITYEETIFELYINDEKRTNSFVENKYGNNFCGVSTDTLIHDRNFYFILNENDSNKILNDFEDIINKQKTKNLDSKLKIYFNRYADDWSLHSNIDKSDIQSIDKIFLPENMMNDITKRIDDFYSSEEKYKECGKTHKLTFLLKGKAGMGKTSIAKSIAAKYSDHMYSLNMANKHMCESDLIDLFRKIQPKSVLVLEDIDAFFVGRKTGQESQSQISFTTLINLLDGNLSVGNGLITFITANHAENLDNALVRPGRIDKIINFGDMTRDQFDNAWRAKIGENESPDDELFRICQRSSISMSALMYVFLFGNTTEERRNIARQTVEERVFNDNYNSMYY